MKTREFDIKNYSTSQIIYEIAQREVNKTTKTITHRFVTTEKELVYVNFYSGSVAKFNDLSKVDQKLVIAEAKKQYRDRKDKSIKDYKDMKDKCDSIYVGNKQYIKLVPELENLYYCQALTALSDFHSRIMKSKSVTNSTYQARAMGYSKVACD
jgi:hypothetical protein